MPTIDVTKPEYDYLLALLGKRPWEEVHWLIMKIGHQGQAQERGNGDAATRVGERPDSGTLSPRIAAEVAPPDRRDSDEQRAPRPSRR